MSTLLVIGNGFDLNLGLPTSYNHFIKSNLFQDILSKNNLAKHLINQLHLQKWVDIELELKNYSLLNDENIRNDFEELRDCLQNYLSEIDVSKINVNSHAYQLIESLNLDDMAVVDFNYTDSLSYIVQQNAFLRIKGTIQEDKYLKIHGSLKGKDIIFGIEDYRNLNTKHIFLHKSFNKNFGNGNPFEYLNWYDTIIFFGVSLGETDHMYFLDFFMDHSVSKKDKEIKFYHYGEKGREDLHIQLHTLTTFRTNKFKYYNRVEFIDSSLPI
jgi:hypothetical protein